MRLKDIFASWFNNHTLTTTIKAPIVGNRMDLTGIPVSSYKPVKGVPRPSDTYRAARRNAKRGYWSAFPLEVTLVTSKHRALTVGMP